MLKEYDTFSLHYQLGGGSRWRQVPVVSIHAGIDHINSAECGMHVCQCVGREPASDSPCVRTLKLIYSQVSYSLVQYLH